MEKNLTLAIQALTWQGADYLIEELKERNLWEVPCSVLTAREVRR